MTKRRLSLVLCLLFLLSSGCVSKYFYYPTPIVYQTPAHHGLEYEDVTFVSKDETKLSGWFVKAGNAPKGTVIHFHGNAQNMTAHFSFVKWLPAEDFNLFVFDYRGYGQSEGEPTRRGVYEDSVAAIRYVRERDDVDPQKLLVLGQSLGGANAIAAVGSGEREGIKAVAIESAFYSYRSIVRDKMKGIPIVSWFRYPLSLVVIGNGKSPGKVVENISPIPLLLIHGARDRTIPPHHGVKLFEKAEEPKLFWLLKDGRHTEAFTDRHPDYKADLVSFYLWALEKEIEDGKQKREDR